MHYASNKKGNKSHGKIEKIVQVNQKQQSSIIVYIGWNSTIHLMINTFKIKWSSKSIFFSNQQLVQL